MLFVKIPILWVWFFLAVVVSVISSLLMEIIKLTIKGFTSCSNLCTCVVSGQLNSRTWWLPACQLAAAHAWGLTKEADGSRVSSGARAPQGDTQLGNIPFVSGLLHPSGRNYRKLSFSCDLHCGCNLWDFK